MSARCLWTAFRLPPTERLLIAEAAAALLLARAGDFLPFRILARCLGGLEPPGFHPRHRSLTNRERETVRAVRWAIRTVAPRSPFRAFCLQRAVAARLMLARRGIGSVLHLGVDVSAVSALTAHAWLDADGIEVTGHPVDPALREAGRFV